MSKDKVDQKALLVALAQKAGIEIPMKEKKEWKTKYAKEVVTPDELASLMDAAEKPIHRMAILILYSFALRSQELLNLRVADVDLANRTLTLRNTKTEQITSMNIPPDIVGDLAKWIEGKSPEDPVIDMEYSTIYKMLNRTAKKLGILKKLGTHGMRRSRATDEINKDSPPKKIQDLLRQKNFSTTEMYIRFSKKRGGDLQDEFVLPKKPLS